MAGLEWSGFGFSGFGVWAAWGSGLCVQGSRSHDLTVFIIAELLRFKLFGIL